MLNILPTPIERAILITGIINLISALFLFLACRFMPALTVTKGITKRGWYKTACNYHFYGWWDFLPSVTWHVVLVVIHILSGG